MSAEVQFAIFGIVATTIWAGVTFYIGHRLIIGSDLRPPMSLIAWALLVLVSVTAPFTMFFLRRATGDTTALAWIGFTAMGFFAILLCFTVFKDVAFLIARLLSVPADPERRQFFSTVANGGVLATSLVSTGVGLHTARKKPVVERVDIPIPNLPEALRGFTIAQFSDLHVGPTIKRPYVENVRDILNDLDADMIAFTGDLIDGFPNDLAEDLAPLADLKSKHGTFYVTGNHEYYWNAPAWVRFVKQNLGFKPLENGHEIIEVGGAKLLVGGVHDYGASRFQEASSPIAAKKGAPVHDVSVLLAHQPKSVYEAIEAGFDIQLSGHTHGGQFWPWNLFVGLAHPFSVGLTYYKKAIYAYVNRGTGYWGPPNRFGIPCEVTLITLKNA